MFLILSSKEQHKSHPNVLKLLSCKRYRNKTQTHYEGHQSLLMGELYISILFRLVQNQPTTQHKQV